VAELAVRLARGLAKAHSHRIYYRELKPTDVLLRAEGQAAPKIADFGLSRLVSAASNCRAQWHDG
jgi:serine/threonine protein kinase